MCRALQFRQGLAFVCHSNYRNWSRKLVGLTWREKMRSLQTTEPMWVEIAFPLSL
jgi:hypothetical protein